MCLLQPLICFAHPCLGNPDTVDTSSKSGNHSHSQDADSCDSTVCCAEYAKQYSDITPIYAPLVSSIAFPDQNQKLPKLVIPIFVPPQNFS